MESKDWDLALEWSWLRLVDKLRSITEQKRLDKMSAFLIFPAEFAANGIHNLMILRFG